MKSQCPSVLSRVYRRAGLVAILLTAALCALLYPSSARADVVEGLPYITNVEVAGIQPCDTCPTQVCYDQPVVVTVSGVITNGCVSFRGFRREPTRGLIPILVAEFVEDTCAVACPAVVQEFSASVEFPPLERIPGVYPFWVESRVRTCPDTTQYSRTGARPFEYEVVANCGEPPPLDSLLASWIHFRVLPEHPCPTDPIRIEMTENGCPPCFQFESLEYSSETGLRAVANWRPNCLEFACRIDSQTVVLPPGFQAGHHMLAAHVQVNILDTPVADSSVAFTVPITFDVFPTCDTTQAGCVTPVLFAATGEVGCAIQLAPGGEGALTLFTRTPVPLGGLQGEISCPPPFRVTGVFPPDVPGLHVSWAPEGERGARYVVFATGGATIGPRTSPVLRVALAADPGTAPGTRGALYPMVRLASDPSGVAVPVCDLSNIRIAGVPLCVLGPVSACDVNDDALSDVRDLVIMSRCLFIDLPPGGSPTCPDCNGDGAWAFADLLCCAQHILRLPLPPRDSIGAGLEVTIEEIARDEVGAELRVRLSGADQLGAAMLRLRYPASRWQAFDMRVVPLATTTPGTGWFPLIDLDLPGVLQLGGLRLAADASSELEFLIRFVPVGAPRDDDELVVEGADLAASDGSAFTIASLPRFTIPPPTGTPVARIELGPARPNPFARTTNFAVSLPQAAQVELTVHDLFGRRVATLLSGMLPAGRQDAVWNAGTARDGVYFARLVVNGRVFTQRVALLRDRR